MKFVITMLIFELFDAVDVTEGTIHLKIVERGQKTTMALSFGSFICMHFS